MEHNVYTIMQAKHKTCTLDEKDGNITGKGNTGNCADVKSSHRTDTDLDEATNIVIKSEMLDIDYTESSDCGLILEGQENVLVKNVPGDKCVNVLPAGITTERFQDSKIKIKVEHPDVGDTLNYCHDISKEVLENVQGTHVLEDNGDSTSSDGLLLKSSLKIIPDLYEESAINIKLQKPDEDDVGNNFCDLIEEKMRIKQEKSDNVDMGNYFCDIIDEMQANINIQMEHNYCRKQERRHDAFVSNDSISTLEDVFNDNGFVRADGGGDDGSCGGDDDDGSCGDGGNDGGGVNSGGNDRDLDNMDTGSGNSKDKDQDGCFSKNMLDHQQPLAARMALKCELCKHSGEYHCKTCGKIFMNSRGLANHTRTHSINKTFQYQECDLEPHLCFHNGNKAYKCKICGKAYTLSCSELKSLTCKYCDKTFSQKSRLKVHLRFHTGEKPFQCLHCDKTFYQKEHLKVHHHIHTAEKPFKCQHCEKTFSHKGTLDLHLRTHTDHKLSLACKHCDKTFSQKSSLKIHLRIHTGEKPFECPHCDKMYCEKRSLNEHLRMHTGEKPFECPHCDKKFSHRSSVKVHLRIHTGEKPFKCPHCNKTFSRKAGRKVHLRTHTGEKLFKCPHCDKMYSEKRSLNKHLCMHTGEKPFKCPTVIRHSVGKHN